MSVELKQADAMSGLAAAKEDKALAEYRTQMAADPTSREAQHALELWLVTLRAVHEARIEVFRAIRAERAVT